MFCRRLPSIFSTSHKMQRLPRNCTLSPLDAALPMRCEKACNTTRLKCCACHKKWRWTLSKGCGWQENCPTSFDKVAKILRVSLAKRLSTVSRTRLNVRKRKACNAKRNNDTSETAKKDHFCKHSIGTIISSSRRPLRTVATVNATSSEHTLHPQTPRVKRELVLSIREKLNLDYCRDLSASSNSKV